AALDVLQEEAHARQQRRDHVARFAGYPQLEHGLPRMDARGRQRRLLSMYRIEQTASSSRS
ncbi:MAG: hypothetical protein ABI797_07555, partial [Chloroflexota bacterium]